MNNLTQIDAKDYIFLITKNRAQTVAKINSDTRSSFYFEECDKMFIRCDATASKEEKKWIKDIVLFCRDSGRRETFVILHSCHFESIEKFKEAVKFCIVAFNDYKISKMKQELMTKNLLYSEKESDALCRELFFNLNETCDQFLELIDFYRNMET